MLQAFHKLHSKLKTIPKLKSELQQLRDDLPQTTITYYSLTVMSEHMRLGQYSGHFELYT